MQKIVSATSTVLRKVDKAKMFYLEDEQMIIFLFSLVFIKKIIKLVFFFKNPKLVQTDRFWFGYFEKKPAQTGLVRFFWFGSVFFRFWLGFFWFGLALFWFFLRFGFSSV
jgi:nucleoside diphosphate kinase